MNLQEYWDLLNKHDWYSVYSDDARSRKAGDKSLAKLTDIAMEESEEHRALLVGFKRYKFSGPAFPEEKQPKPERPESL